MIPNGAAGLVSPAFPSNISVVTADTAGFRIASLKKNPASCPGWGLAYRISDKTVFAVLSECIQRCSPEEGLPELGRAACSYPEGPSANPKLHQ